MSRAEFKDKAAYCPFGHDKPCGEVTTRDWVEFLKTLDDGSGPPENREASDGQD